MRHGRCSLSVWGYDAVNREAQITSVLILGFTVAFHPHKDDANRTQFRRWLAATTHRLLKARN
jgi:hypothetical protein